MNGAFTGAALVVWFVVPESPRWLCEKGNHEKARKILTSINGGVQGYDVDREYSIIQREVDDGRRLNTANKQVNIWSCFRGTSLVSVTLVMCAEFKRRTLISFIPFAWQQWGGNAVINTYTTYFFQLAGLANPFLASVIIKSVLFCASPNK